MQDILHLFKLDLSPRLPSLVTGHCSLFQMYSVGPFQLTKEQIHFIYTSFNFVVGNVILFSTNYMFIHIAFVTLPCVFPVVVEAAWVVVAFVVESLPKKLLRITNFVSWNNCRFIFNISMQRSLLIF